jgi:hypothetical protein
MIQLAHLGNLDAAHDPHRHLSSRLRGGRRDARARQRVWLEPRVVDRLRYLRGPGESYSDVILRLVEMEGAARWFTETERPIAVPRLTRRQPRSCTVLRGDP